jgi:crotonobetainyl-CoA:carnitine CoA-transferase CaiB-like acyl-CoA transferase
MYNLLHGLKIIDLTTIVLGPYATQILGDLGADVIKVEPPEGDLYRAARPGRSDSMGAPYMAINRNKRSVAVDLKTPEGQAVVRRLAKTADVVVHNMRAKSAAKLGLSYETLKQENPRLVYCFSAGFGAEGPMADAPAYDDIIQGVSGLAALNRDSTGAPRYLPTIVGDKVSGLHLALAVLAGIVRRDRTGEGSAIEAPMFESMVSFIMAEHIGARAFIPPMGDAGYARLLAPDRNPFPTRDGYIAMLPYSTPHWRKFFEAVGRADLAGADWVCDPAQRSARIGELYRTVAAITPTKTTAEWLALLKTLDVPSAPVNSLDELFDEEHLNAVDFFQDMEHPTEGRLRFARTPFRVAGARAEPDRPPPNLGDSTDAILAGAGYAADEIAEMRKRGIVK